MNRLEHQNYNWEGVMQFLYNQYQHSSQKQNIWALERQTLKETINQLAGKIMALQNINKELKNRNTILQYSLRQMKIKNHQKRSHQNKFNNSENIDINQKARQELPKVPQRRPKPNKANLSKMLCSLGIPQLLEDLKKDLEPHQKPQPQGKISLKIEPKRGFQLDLSKMQVQSRQFQTISKLPNYQLTHTLQGHIDGVRDIAFINFDNQLKQIISVSEDSTLKVWQVQNNSSNKITQIQCSQTIRDHTGPIFTCVQGDGYVFTGGMEGIIRAYNFKNQSNQEGKQRIAMKWKADQNQSPQPLWQLLYDRDNKLLISTASEMPIKAYKISDILQQSQQSKFSVSSKISSPPKSKQYCQFLYNPKTNESQDCQQFIPTAVCLYNANLIASYFNSSSLVSFDIETQRIIRELDYKIQSNLSANKLVSHARYIVGAYEDCNIRLFDSRKMVECFRAHSEPVMSVSTQATNQNLLFSCGQDGYIRLWDVRKLKMHVWETLAHVKKNDQSAHCIQTNMDGITASGGADSLLKVYSPIT